MRWLFVDTSAFYAAADTSDRHHSSAADTFAARGVVGDLVTTDHVLVETWFLLRARLGRPAAMRFWGAMEGGVVGVLGVTAEELQRGRRIAGAWPDQDFSLVDCTSFAAIERRSILEAFSYDAHFRIVRLGPRKTRAIRVLP